MTITRKSMFAAVVGPQKKPVICRALLQEMADIAVLENQACAKKVELAAAIWDSCVHQNVQVGDVISEAGSYAASETAVALGCSKSVADTFAEIGMDLRLRLPAVKAAFDAGEIDLARVRAIYRLTSVLSLEAAARIEPEVLAAARHLSPGPLATEISDIIARNAPEEAAAVRKDLRRLTRVRYRDRDLIATIEADLEAADAAASWQLINEMADTLCRRDPRTRGQRLAAAYVAIMHQETYIACLCEQDENNPCTATRQRPDRRAPLINVTVDLATLLGLSDSPGYLAGHGLIDAEYVRELSADSDVRVLLVEAADIAARLELLLDSADDRHPETDAPAPTPTPTPTPTSESESESDEASRRASDEEQRRAPEGCRAPGRTSAPHLTFSPLGRGRRRRGLKIARPLIIKSTGVPDRADTFYRGTYTLIEELEKAIVRNPSIATPVYPDGQAVLRPHLAVL